MERILITGSSAAGKTTLGKELSKKLNLKLFHLDKYFWKPNWVKPELDEWRETVFSLVEGDKWIIEGNYGSTFDIRFPKATMIIHFEISPYICLYRAIKRSIKTGKSVREDMAEGCFERFDIDFYKYILSYPKKFGPRVYQSRDEFFTGEFVIIRNSNDLNNLYSRLGV